MVYQGFCKIEFSVPRIDLVDFIRKDRLTIKITSASIERSGSFLDNIFDQLPYDGYRSWNHLTEVLYDQLEVFPKGIDILLLTEGGFDLEIKNISTIFKAIVSENPSSRLAIYEAIEKEAPLKN